MFLIGTKLLSGKSSVKINQNSNWPSILDHSYRISIIVGSESGRSNVLLNLIKVNGQVLTKFTCMSKIHSNQSITSLLTEQKK